MKIKTIEELKNELLNLQDVCEILKIKRSTVYNWIVQKKIPVVKMGRSVRFRRTAIEEFINRMTVASCANVPHSRKRRARRKTAGTSSMPE